MSQVETVYLSLGSNIGDRAAYLQQALRMIANIPKIQDFSISSFYETSPVSEIPQHDYLNAVCRFNTIMHPISLRESLLSIEQSLGRTPSKLKNAPREIDIDILFFGNQKFKDEQHNLEIPHPRWRERLFVVVPCLDLTSTITIECKQTGKEIVDLIKLKDSLTNQSQLIKLYS